MKNKHNTDAYSDEQHDSAVAARKLNGISARRIMNWPLCASRLPCYTTHVFLWRAKGAPDKLARPLLLLSVLISPCHRAAGAAAAASCRYALYGFRRNKTTAH